MCQLMAVARRMWSYMKISLLLILLLLPQLASARVYMCVDPNTGKTSFTDRGCQTASYREEVRVDPANLGSGKRAARGKAPDKTWNSERDSRKSGIEYNEQRRHERENNSTASVDPEADYEGS